MRLLLTADWHLGRIFYGMSLIEDQVHVLDQLVRMVEERRPDAVLVAGDIYDRAVTPPEAIELLDDTLSRIVLGLKTPVVLIAGNHDSPQRIGYGSRILDKQGLHVSGVLPREINPVVLEDEHGLVRIYPVPYADPADVRRVTGDATLKDHDASTAALLDGILSRHPVGCRSVLMAHAFLDGGLVSDSERAITVGGAGSVAPGRFEGFDLVVLGHLHRPQSATSRGLYPGSLLKLSFQESDQAKSVSLVEMDAAGRWTEERIPLVPRRDVRRVEGTMDDLLRDPGSGESREDYIDAVLLDDGPILDAMARLQAVYPNALHLEFKVKKASGPSVQALQERRGQDIFNLFTAFYREVEGAELEEEAADVFKCVVEQLNADERGGAS